MKHVIFLLAMCTLISTVQAQPHYRALHERAIVTDGHNDILLRVIRGESIEVLTTKGHSDLPRFREGGMDVQLFSIWIHPKYAAPGESFKRAVEEIDSLDAIIKRNPWLIAKATSSEKLVAAVNRKALAAVYAIEGCHPAEGSLENIRTLYRKGVRVFGLTWNNSTKWSHSSNDETEGKGKGITAEGKKLIALLDSLGAVVDVSHSGEQSFWDLMNIVKHPVIASHSSCKGVCDHHRNLTDKQLKAIAATGGVAMINYFPGFILDDMPNDVRKSVKAAVEKMDARKKQLGKDTQTYLAYRDSLIADADSKGLPTILDVADHIMHAVKVAGAEHVGLGSDFDGIGYAPIGIHDVTELPYLTRELLRRGLKDEDIMNILGGNFVRIFSQIAR